jgi:hypothetical protein
LAISITRRQALQLKAVLRRAFGARGPGPAVCFTADVEGLRARAMSADVAVEYRGPGAGPGETLWLPFAFLADCEGKKDDLVQLDATGKKWVTAQWRDGSVPQIVRYEAESTRDADKLPALPEMFAENPPALLQALADAYGSCDPDSFRFALDHTQLRGEQGTIIATDGRQLLVQNGFQFPWTGDLLVPRSKVFTSAELPHDQPVRVGKTGNWVAIGAGPWTIYLAINVEGRYPDVTKHIPAAADVKTRCLLSAADAGFLAEVLRRLPCDDDYNRPVTLDLNGQVVARAKDADNPRPTEVVLAGSSLSGEPIRLNTNRDYLARAMRLGLRELAIADSKTALACSGENRVYVWMPLDPESAIPPANEAIRIESPASGPDKPAAQPRTERKVSPVCKSTTDSSQNAATSANGSSSSRVGTNGRAKHNGEARRSRAGQQDIASLIQQAETLRTSLRDTLVKVNELLRGLKRHRRQSRAVQQTLDQLRTLKTLGV